ncbi:MAG: hypothetical protein AB7F82_09450 [Alphaproteobacteria bacterium]
MKKKMYIILAGSITIASAPLLAYANVPMQKFYPLERKAITPQEQAAERRFIPLQRRPGRPLLFKPSGAQAIKNHNHEPVPVIHPQPDAQPVQRTKPEAKVSPHDASQLLSIYEAVD